jgi:Protein of unknown function (DUF2806)
MDIKDLIGISKPLTKLLEVISSGMGTLYKPTGIRREASAQADAIRLLGNAQQETDMNRVLAMATTEAATKVFLVEASLQIEERARIRLEHREVQRQSNLEAVAESAIAHVSEKNSSEKVDENWKTRFFNIAEDVSEPQMQELWGRILAGEVAVPGSYSVRTLEVLKNLSKEEAELFQKIRYLSLDQGQILKVRGETDLGSSGISFDEILHLREAGLLADGDSLSSEMHIPENRNFMILGYNGKVLLIELSDKTVKQIDLNVLVLTKAGVELLSLIDPLPDVVYLKAIASSYRGIADFFLGISGQPKDTFLNLSAS